MHLFTDAPLVSTPISANTSTVVLALLGVYLIHRRLSGAGIGYEDLTVVCVVMIAYLIGDPNVII